MTGDPPIQYTIKDDDTFLDGVSLSEIVIKIMQGDIPNDKTAVKSNDKIKPSHKKKLIARIKTLNGGRSEGDMNVGDTINVPTQADARVFLDMSALKNNAPTVQSNPVTPEKPKPQEKPKAKTEEKPVIKKEEPKEEKQNRTKKSAGKVKEKIKNAAETLDRKIDDTVDAVKDNKAPLIVGNPDWKDIKLDEQGNLYSTPAQIKGADLDVGVNVTKGITPNSIFVRVDTKRGEIGLHSDILAVPNTLRPDGIGLQNGATQTFPQLNNHIDPLTSGVLGWKKDFTVSETLKATTYAGLNGGVSLIPLSFNPTPVAGGILQYDPNEMTSASFSARVAQSGVRADVIGTYDINENITPYAMNSTSADKGYVYNTTTVGVNGKTSFSLSDDFNLRVNGGPYVNAGIGNTQDFTTKYGVSGGINLEIKDLNISKAENKRDAFKGSMDIGVNVDINNQNLKDPQVNFTVGIPLNGK